MRIKHLILLQLLIVFGGTQLLANTNPVVENVAFTYSGATVTITYDLKDAEQTTVNIRLLVSEDSGLTWVEITSGAAGDIGDLTGITATAAQKTITWTYNGSNQATMKIKILADDKTADGSPCPDTPTVTYSGKTYNTIQIADQCWLKENLDVGTEISSFGGNQTDNGVIEKYCYNYTSSNCTTYGGLYQWNEAMQYVTTEGTQGICPTGWHIPTYAELKTLQTYVNNESVNIVDQSQNMSNGLTPTNESGFSALFAGFWDSNSGGYYDYEYYRTYYWSSTELSSATAYNMYLIRSDSNVLFDILEKNNGHSVRCIKD